MIMQGDAVKPKLRVVAAEVHDVVGHDEIVVASEQENPKIPITKEIAIPKLQERYGRAKRGQSRMAVS